MFAVYTNSQALEVWLRGELIRQLKDRGTDLDCVAVSLVEQLGKVNVDHGCRAVVDDVVQ